MTYEVKLLWTCEKNARGKVRISPPGRRNTHGCKRSEGMMERGLEIFDWIDREKWTRKTKHRHRKICRPILCNFVGLYNKNSYFYFV